MDLSDLCFVDDLVSLLIFWRKSQLSRFAEMVSQVLETLELQDQVRAAEIARGACQLTFRGETNSICGRSSCVASIGLRDVETLDKWQNRALRHCARSPVHVSRERTQDLRKRLGVHTAVSTLQVRRLLWA